MGRDGLVLADLPGQDRTVDPDFVFIVTYQCPRCHADLETRSSGPPAWLRCPSCGRASLPPEHNRDHRPGSIDAESVVISAPGGGASGAAALPPRPRSMAAMPSAPAPRAPATRLMLGSGFFLTTFLFVFSLLESNGLRAALFGVTAAVFLFLLSRPVGRDARR